MANIMTEIVLTTTTTVVLVRYVPTSKESMVRPKSKKSRLFANFSVEPP